MTFPLHEPPTAQGGCNKKETLVFVYGTLRKGLHNHHYLRTARFVGQALTCAPYAMFVGRYPYVQEQPEDPALPLTRITGEVYALDCPTLAAVDELEDHPDDYCRRVVEVSLASGDVVAAWLYFHPAPEGVWTPSGDVFAMPMQNQGK